MRASITMPHSCKYFLLCFLLCARLFGAGGNFQVEKITYEPNPGGLQIGFWANYNRTADILRDFGPRPVERVNFLKWRQIEKSPGQYDWKNAFLFERYAHMAGATVVTNINTIFTSRINPQGMECIPETYPQDITDPKTRAAARRFLAAATEEMLAQAGSVWLALDYEFLWFGNPKTPEIRKAYRDWFVESAALIRETAAKLGAADRVKIVIIVNTDPYEVAQVLLGSPASPKHTPQKWMLDCVRAADIFAIDTYAGGNAPKVSAQSQLEVIRFWIKYYALDRPVFVTESGCSTSREHGDTTRGYHLRGTEAEQAAFFKEMFAALEERRHDPQLRRLAGYCVWSYLDQGTDPSVTNDAFGLRRADNTPKPAFAVVGEAIARLESSPKNTPVRQSAARDITADLSEGRPVTLHRKDGVSYDTVRFTLTPPEAQAARFLELETSTPVSYTARVGEAPWSTSLPETSTRHRIALDSLPSGTVSRILVNFTAPVFPVETQLLRARIVEGR